MWGGVSAARNVGLGCVVDCKWIAFVDADDYLDDDYISKMISYSADVIVSGSRTWDNGKVISKTVYKNQEKTIDELRSEYYELGGFGGPCSKLYRKSITDGTLFDIDLKTGEDAVFNLNLFRKIKKVQYIDYCGYNICTNETSLTHKIYGQFSYLLDFEYHKMWSQRIEWETINAGIPKESVYTHAENYAAIIIYEMLKNLFSENCPYSKDEKKRKIKMILNYNVDRERVFSAKAPVSGKLNFLVRMMMKLNNVDITYALLKLYHSNKKVNT